MTLAVNTAPMRRNFLPADFRVSDWPALAPYFQALLARDISSLPALEQWLRDASELSSVLYEDMAWRYIGMTCDTGSPEKAERYRQFVAEIQPQAAPLEHQLNQMLLASPALPQLQGEAYDIMRKRLQASVALFREENVPLLAALQEEQQRFNQLAGNMTVDIDGQELTMPQAANLLQSLDRSLRERAYRAAANRRLQDADAFDELFSSLVRQRHQVAVNAGFPNYRDYAFRERNRFDYTPADCLQFHESIAARLMPLSNRLAESRKQRMGLAELKPWDLMADPSGQPPLKAFSNTEELIDKAVECFRRLHPFLGQCMQTMKEMGRLDLGSRKGKSPGGYNYPLMESGIPFVFMNATSTVRDLTTLMHEGGHAVHSILTKDLPLLDFKNLTPEIAELASMSMELMSMDHWDLFFENEEDLRRAKINQLEDVMSTLPWVALIDRFQHWVYEHPEHTVAERDAAWLELHARFSPQATDWSGCEQARTKLWQRQLHLFELPFYYIEYAFAQLGAIAVWRNYRQNPGQALEQYLEGLSLGYTRSINGMYETAGARFDFSPEYIGELIGFVEQEWEALQ